MNGGVFRLLIIALIVFTGCRKTGGGPSPADRLNDEILEISRDVYLWHNQIPKTFNPHVFPGPEELMTAIRDFSMEPGFTRPVDDFSFAMEKSEWDAISAGVTTDFGLNVFFFGPDDLRVRAVEKASAAGLAGIRRGWRITKINGNTNITTSNTDFISNSIYGAAAATITFKKPDGTLTDIVLTSGTYNENPVYLDTVYTVGSKKAGYLVLNSFLGNRSIVTNTLGSVFNRFVFREVTDVIVDLRYNGGGYVSLQQTLANFLAPLSADGKLMMKEEYNEKHAADNQTTLFQKRGNLDVDNIYFIVSGNTASASELLINNLRPYMNVKLVGEDTYGKPVGFFPIEAGNWYVFPVSFRSTNSEGAGNYFNGIPVDREVADGLDKDWGDTEEDRLASVLNHIETGAFGFVPQRPGLNSTLESDIREVNKKLDKTFRGAVISE